MRLLLIFISEKRLKFSSRLVSSSSFFLFFYAVTFAHASRDSGIKEDETRVLEHGRLAITLPMRTAIKWIYLQATTILRNIQKLNSSLFLHSIEQTWIFPVMRVYQTRRFSRQNMKRQVLASEPKNEVHFYSCILC